jgi:hypothetical protein
MESEMRSKSSADVWDFALLSAATVVAVMVRVMIGHRRWRPGAVSMALIGGLCIVAVAVYLVVPALAET